MPVINDILSLNIIAQKVHLSDIFLHRHLLLPLERAVRLWNEAGGGNCYAHSPVFILCVQPPCVQHLICKLSYAKDILIGLGRQAKHEVELNRIPAALERKAACVQQIFLGDVFVYSVAQALASGLGRKRQSAFARFLYAVHNVHGEVVSSQRRQRKANAARLAVAEKIVAQLGTTLRTYDTLDTFGVYPNGGKVTDKPEILFARIDPKEMGEKIAAVEAKYAPKEEPKKEIEGLARINIEDFAKIELRAAKVVACEPIKRAKKLLKLTLDDGTSTPRTVASGIAKWYKPEDLIGKKLGIVCNLAPRPMMKGKYVSEGMILAADAGEDDVRVVFVDGTPAGSKIR